MEHTENWLCDKFARMMRDKGSRKTRDGRKREDAARLFKVRGGLSLSPRRQGGMGLRENEVTGQSFGPSGVATSCKRQPIGHPIYRSTRSGETGNVTFYQDRYNFAKTLPVMRGINFGFPGAWLFFEKLIYTITRRLSRSCLVIFREENLFYI